MREHEGNFIQPSLQLWSNSLQRLGRGAGGAGVMLFVSKHTYPLRTDEEVSARGVDVFDDESPSVYCGVPACMCGEDESHNCDP